MPLVGCRNSLYRFANKVAPGIGVSFIRAMWKSNTVYSIVRSCAVFRFRELFVAARATLARDKSVRSVSYDRKRDR